MKGRTLTAVLLAPLVLTVFAAGCASEKKITTPPQPTNAYVGSAACGSLSPCHRHDAIVTQAAVAGHHNMLTRVVNGQRPGSPLLLPDNPPNGLSWSLVQYVIGGFGWKALFVTADGQIATGSGAQYDLPSDHFPDPAFGPYSPGQTVTYDDSCFKCHTVGPDSTSGTFFEAGVQCEACHGMGKFHTLNPDSTNIVFNDSAELCRRCHSRSANGTRISASGGFIENYQQYQEFKEGPHAGFKCATCHNHHVGIAAEQLGGLVAQCTDCHTNQPINHLQINGHPDCIDCHMAQATLSARSLNRYVGDLPTHIFRIHTGPDSMSTMFETVGGKTLVKQDYGVTLDFACYSCHKDAQGVGGVRSQKSLPDLYAKELVIHNPPGLSRR
jgi:hypothetical protein